MDRSGYRRSAGCRSSLGPHARPLAEDGGAGVRGGPDGSDPTRPSLTSQILPECPSVSALDPRLVRIPRIPRRDVVFLSKGEVTALLDAIVPPGESWRTAPLPRLCFRALAEVLLGTGARISEILALDRAHVNLERREAKAVGKGNKERTLFFNERSLEWLRRYHSRRRDDEAPLFVAQKDPPKRLTYASVKNFFQRLRVKMGIDEKVTAHILRHTMATTPLFNGCPIGHIKAMLGHERLDTTCRYYLGLDLRAAKEAHQNFLRYE